MAKLKFNVGAVITDVGSTEKTKTGDWRTLKPVIDKSKCTKCGLCWMYCPDNAINENFDIDYDFCKGCLICMSVCPVKAISSKKEEK